jgi:hypothetical protein
MNLSVTEHSNSKNNDFGGVVVSMLALSAVCLGFEPQSGTRMLQLIYIFFSAIAENNISLMSSICKLQSMYNIEKNI